MPQVRMRTQADIPSELRPEEALLQQLQERIFGTERHHIREHAPRPADVALRNQPRERIAQGSFRQAAAKGNGHGFLRIRVENAAPNPQGDGERGIQGNLRGNRGDRRDLRRRKATQGQQA